MENIVGQIISGLFGGGVAAILVVVIYNRIIKQIDSNTRDIKKVKENYIGRFEKVNNGISAIRISIARIETKLESK